MQRDFLACPVAPLHDCLGLSLISGAADLISSLDPTWRLKQVHAHSTSSFALALKTHLRVLKLINGSPLERGMTIDKSIIMENHYLCATYLYLPHLAETFHISMI